jgi:hypothetical protein
MQADLIIGEMTVGTDEEGVPEVFVGEQLLHHRVLRLKEGTVHPSPIDQSSHANQSVIFRESSKSLYLSEIKKIYGLANVPYYTILC